MGAISLCNLDGINFSPVVVPSPVTFSVSSNTGATISDTSVFSEACIKKNRKPKPICDLIQPSKIQLKNKETCVSLEPFTSLSSTLSPLADTFSPEVGRLYPPGKNKYGRELITDEDSRMHLDYFEDLPNTASEVSPPALPDIANTKKLETWVVKLPDGQEFVDKLLC